MSVSEIANISRMINYRSIKFLKNLTKVEKFGVYSVYPLWASTHFTSSGQQCTPGLKIIEAGWYRCIFL